MDQFSDIIRSITVVSCLHIALRVDDKNIYLNTKNVLDNTAVLFCFVFLFFWISNTPTVKSPW